MVGGNAAVKTISKSTKDKSFLQGLIIIHVHAGETRTHAKVNLYEMSTYKSEGGVRVCGIAVLGYFWCGFAVIFFSKHGNAVFKVQAVRGNFKFYVAVIGEKIVVSR